MAESYSDIGSVDLQALRRIVIEGDWGWFAITIDDALAEEFSDSEVAEIEKDIDEPSFAQLEFSSTFAGDLAVRTMPVDTEILIDNDHGLIRSIEYIRLRIQAGLEWQTSST